jgi:hypothetical protein
MTVQTTERPWWKKDGDHYRVTIQMYHNHPPLWGDTEQGQDHNFSLWFHTAWDSFMVAEALCANDLTDGHGQPDDEAMRKAWDQAVGPMTGHAPPQEVETGLDVFWLMGSEVEMKRLANHWADSAIQDCQYVGGDDSYYDYYPDYLAGLWQLCRALDYPDPYLAAASNAWSTRYEGDEEAKSLIPPYDKEV